MKDLLSDFGYALRSLRRSPGFTAVALLTLVLGIGVNAAIFSVVDAVLLRPLPYPEADRILRLWGYYTQRDLPPSNASEGELVDYQQQSRTLESLGAFVSLNANLTGEGEPERVLATYATAGFFPALGVAPAAGRFYGAEEDAPGGPRGVVISHGLWQRRFAADPQAVGKDLMVNGQPAPVLGVAPEGFRFPDETEIWMPLQLDPAEQSPRGQHYLGLIGRLKPGVTLGQAQEDLGGIAARFGERFPVEYPPESGWEVRAVSLRDDLVGDTRPALLVLSAAVGLVLLIACVNVANLLLARAQTREREVALRVALGATRSRVTLASLAESLLLALAGGALGLLLASWALRLLLAVNPAAVPRSGEIGLDARVAAFTFGLALLTGLLLGLVPAVRAFRPDLQASLKEGGTKATAGAGARLFRRALVGLEVALALVLLIGAGLTIRSFAQLSRVDPGFRPERLLTLGLSLSYASYGEGRQVAQFYDRLLDRVEKLPGVVAASSISYLPLSGAEDRSGTVGAEGMPFRPGDSLPEPSTRAVDYRYFKTLGVDLVSGRFFTAGDDEKAFPMAIIDQALAERLWPGQDAAGRRLKMGPPTEENENPWITVVGVVREVKEMGLGAPSRGTIYFPQLRRIERAQYLVVRTETDDPLALADEVRAEIRAADKDQPAADVKAMEQRLASSLARPRFAMLLMSLFAAVAAALAAVGIYGVVSYTVAERTHEIGIRMALGAQRGDVLRMVVRQGMLVVLAGLAAGLLVAFWATRGMANLLYGVAATDLVTFVGVPVFLALVALLANFLPARRAVRVEPVTALRYE